MIKYPLGKTALKSVYDAAEDLVGKHEMVVIDHLVAYFLGPQEIALAVAKRLKRHVEKQRDGEYVLW